MNLIADLNDRFRQGDQTLGTWVLTTRVSALPADQRDKLLLLVKEFNAFTPDNDPHEEHDFGAVELEGDHYFWKIDYYDPTMQYLSEAPDSPNATRRILTLMHSSEY